MNKNKLLVLIVVALLVVSITVSAAMLIPRSGKGDENKNDKAPVAPPGLEKVVFIHYKKGFASPFCFNDGVCDELDQKPNCPDCKVSDPEPESTCYAFLGKGVKWPSDDLPVDLSIGKGLDLSVISLAAQEWDENTATQLFDAITSYPAATWDGWADSSPDGKNEMVFGDYPQTGVIAVAVTWGYYTGKPSQRKIIEFDILFDTDYDWYDCTKENCTVANKGMDLQNIATHEIGHGIGLSDLYKAECSEETMYGYSWEGDIQKRDLNTGDIAGLHILYGP